MYTYKVINNLATLPNTWAQTRTIPFKEWFGNWEKRVRINKLLHSSPVVINGNEFEITDNYKIKIVPIFEGPVSGS